MATVGCCDNRPGGRLFGKEEKYPGAVRRGGGQDGQEKEHAGRL